MGRVGFTLSFVLAVGVAAAQPPALSSQPTLVIAKVKDGFLTWTVTELVSDDKVTLVPVDRGGEQTLELLIVPQQKVATTEVVQGLKDVRVSDGKGKSIPIGRLAERLGDGSPVLVYRGTLPGGYRTALREETVLIELPAEPAPQPTQRIPLPLTTTPPTPKTMPPPAALPTPRGVYPDPPNRVCNALVGPLEPKA